MIHACSLDINQLQHDVQSVQTANRDGLTKMKGWNRDIGDWCDELETRVFKLEQAMGRLLLQVQKISDKVDQVSANLDHLAQKTGEQMGAVVSRLAKVEEAVVGNAVATLATGVKEMGI